MPSGIQNREVTNRLHVRNIRAMGDLIHAATTSFMTRSLMQVLHVKRHYTKWHERVDALLTGTWKQTFRAAWRLHCAPR
jgi:hypothetical protein